MTDQFRAYARRTDYNQRIELLIGFKRGDGVFDHGQPLIFERLEPGGIAPPTISLRPEEAQSIMDALWDAGLRPTEGTGSAGALAATQKHLEDMRTIAFRVIEPIEASGLGGIHPVIRR